MGRATDERLAAERAALERRYRDWLRDRVAEDRAESAIVPLEFRCLVEPRDWYPNGRRPGA
jgi:hypothetical protein